MNKVIWNTTRNKRSCAFLNCDHALHTRVFIKIDILNKGVALLLLPCACFKRCMSCSVRYQQTVPWSKFVKLFPIIPLPNLPLTTILSSTYLASSSQYINSWIILQKNKFCKLETLKIHKVWRVIILPFAISRENLPN